MHGKFASLEDLRDSAVKNVGKEWLLTIYDSELDNVREVTLVPTQTWWPGHEGGAGILGCEFACGIVHRLPFIIPSSEDLEMRMKASMPNRSPSISVYVDPLSPNSTPGSSPAPPSFFSPTRVLELSSPPVPAAAVVSKAPHQAAQTVTIPHTADAPSSPSPAPHVALPSTQTPVAAAPTVDVPITAHATRDLTDISDAIKAVDLSTVTSPGRPVLKTVVVERSADVPVAVEEHFQAASEDKSTNQADALPEVDEKQLFQEVKAVLSPKQFKTFTANMKRLNGGSQTGAVTLSNVSDMLSDQPLLQQQLQRFITQVRTPCPQLHSPRTPLASLQFYASV